MLLLSLGLHGLILFAPTAPADDELVPPPDPEEDGITVTRIDPPTVRETAPPPSTTETPAPAATGRRENPAAIAPAANRHQITAPVEASTNASRQGRPPYRTPASRTPESRVRPATANRQDRLPTLAASVNPPDPPPPEVNQSPPSGQRQFLDYADLIATYQGRIAPSPEEANERRAIWLSSFTTKGGSYRDIEIESLVTVEPIPYEAKLCLPGTPDTAELLVLVEADGTVNSDIMTLRSTGYRKFNQAALALAQRHDYPATGQPQAYSVQVRVDYDAANCQWPPTGTSLPDEYFALLESYVGPSSTTLAEARQNQADWLETLAQSGAIASSEVTLLENFQDRVAYPNNICLPIEPTEARLGVVVDAEGNLQGELQPLRSTGYAIFDDRAKALVDAFDFPPAEVTQAYVVVVQTDYNKVNCQPLTSSNFSLTPSDAPLATIAPNREAATEEREAASTDLAFAPDRQQALLDAGRQNLTAQPYGSFNTDPGLAAMVLASGWPETLDQHCFLAQLDETSGPVPVEGATDALLIALNVERAPEAITAQYGVQLHDVGEHCGADLYELREADIPQLFASLVGFGAGNSNTLMVLWPNDPRE
jgi:hypothetical protein